MSLLQLLMGRGRTTEKGEEHWRGAIGRKRTLRMKNTEEEHQGAVLGSRERKERENLTEEDCQGRGLAQRRNTGEEGNH